MKIFITGTSGYLGNNLAHKLAGIGHHVHALIRSDSTKEILQHKNISIFKGDILEKDTVINAMKGCKQVYHTAARVGVWAKKPEEFYNVNVEGTRNVLDAALECSIEKSVFTSTCGVIGPSINTAMNENDPRINGFEIHYDLSKKLGEDLVYQYAKNGMNAVIVSPSKVYGPGNISHALTANAVINTFLKKGITVIPWPGDYQVCFAFIEDIIKGHLLAMEKGISGEKYILGGINISYYDFFNRIRSLSSCSGHIIKLSKNVIKLWAVLQYLYYLLTGKHPGFTVKSIDHLFSNYTFSSEKAIRELGYSITVLDDALTKTIRYLKQD
jgi:nucleoside-diphosphate-sugar epimerase